MSVCILIYVYTVKRLDQSPAGIRMLFGWPSTPRSNCMFKMYLQEVAMNEAE